jgi:glucosyl-3-phosphoglycerate synthase
MPAPAVRTFSHRDFAVDRLVEAKGDRRISLCLPARNEAPTIGPIVSTVRRHLMRKQPLIDDIVVVDDGSTDGTPARAAGAGARVVSAADIAPELGPGSGKGNAMWKSLLVTEGEFVVWCDADVRNFRPCFVTGLLGPLLLEDGIQFSKGFYERPLDGVRGQGGRVTELVARPLISLFFPHLAMFAQPLAGEYAGRRDLLEQVPFVQGYGVDLGLLIDVVERVGIAALAQVDLGVRVHRNRSLDELGPQATAVVHTALSRAGLAAHPDSLPVLTRPWREPEIVEVRERPPVAQLPAAAQQAASGGAQLA